MGGIPREPEHVCIRFRRSPVSLIEEPEVCENCADWEEGFCLRADEAEEGKGDAP